MISLFLYHNSHGLNSFCVGYNSYFDINEIDDENFVMFEADSMEELLSKVQTYAYNSSSNKIMSTSERMVGTTIDFKG